MAVRNNELTDWTADKSSFEETQGQVNVDADHRKLATRQGEAQMLITDDSLNLTNGANGVMVTERGTAVCNPVHMAQDPSQMRINSFWVVNDEIMTTLPSTIYTPMPYLRYSAPVFAEQVTDLATKLASIA